MSNHCTVCAHPNRDEIDSLLVRNAAIYKDLSEKYGLGIGSLCRHNRRHLPETLRKAVEARSRPLVRSVSNRVEKLVQRLEDFATDAHSERAAGKFLAISRELVQALKLAGQISGEVPTAQSTAIFVELGVKGIEELKSALDVVRSSERPSLEQCRLEAVDLLKTVLRERPEWRTGVLAELESAAFVLDSNESGVAP